jgi:sulfur carrier protein ThiS adenylyltransferase
LFEKPKFLMEEFGVNEFEAALTKYISEANLAKIRKTKIGIAGAGGLGSNCAQMLVRSGFKKFKIVDFDQLEPTNLNRQFYFLSQLGRKKVEVLAENLRLINPDILLEISTDKIESGNVSRMFADCDIVVEAFDKAEYKKMLVEAYLPSGKFLVSASGLAGWGDSDRLKVHKIKDNFVLVGDMVSGIEKNLPPLAPCVAIAAAKQADVIISHVLGENKNGVEGAVENG